MSVSIREAIELDGLELARLRWDFRPNHQTAQQWTSFSRSFDEWFGRALASGQWTAAVAESAAGSLVGCMFLRSVSKVPIPGGIHRYWGYVTNAYVEPHLRGQGIGSRLLGLLVSAGKARHHEFLIVWPSEEALRLYRRVGFKEVLDAHAGPDDHPPLELPL
jgi:ribosomal protein S18 acetylase RimI-like enzyme